MLKSTLNYNWQKSRPILGTLLTGMLLLGTGCSSSSPPKTESSDLQITIIKDFADVVIIPTYQQLVAKAAKLSQTTNAFTSNPNETTLKAARDAWIAARAPWEQSEAFAFGPADSLGYDGDLDDWPVNETDVKAVINSNEKITQEFIGNLQTTEKGFHTMELLLFGNNNNKKAKDFSPRELTYLKALATAFDATAKELLQSWQSGVQGKPPYRQVLVTAGDENNPAYPTVAAAIEEIVQGAMGCLDEVGNEKIGEPLATKSAEGLESRFSHTSLNDFKNNVLSVNNAYLGEVAMAGTSGKSLSELVAQKDPELDKQVKEEINKAIAAIDAVPAPIETNLTNESALTKLEAAQTAVLALFSTMEEKVLPLVQ